MYSLCEIKSLFRIKLYWRQLFWVKWQLWLEIWLVSTFKPMIGKVEKLQISLKLQKVYSEKLKKINKVIKPTLIFNKIKCWFSFLHKGKWIFKFPNKILKYELYKGEKYLELNKNIEKFQLCLSVTSSIKIVFKKCRKWMIFFTSFVHIFCVHQIPVMFFDCFCLPFEYFTKFWTNFKSLLSVMLAILEHHSIYIESSLKHKKKWTIKSGIGSLKLKTSYELSTHILDLIILVRI